MYQVVPDNQGFQDLTDHLGLKVSVGDHLACPDSQVSPEDAAGLGQQALWDILGRMVN